MNQDLSSLVNPFDEELDLSDSGTAHPYASTLVTRAESMT
jgi:hypothetical protein